MATSFENVNDLAGISVANLSFGSAWGDFNGDDFPDLWVNNHFDNPGNLYLNQGNGTFTDVTADVFILDELGVVSGNSEDHHGSQWADFDNDGDQDLLQLVGSATTEPNRLFINDGGVLRDAAPELGLSYPEARAQSPIWVDFDNDGLLDLVHTSTTRSDGLTPPTVFRQTSNGFEDVGATVAPEFRSTSSSRGNLGDISGDGNLDLLVDGTNFIFDITSNPFTNVTNTLGGGAGGTDAITADFNGDLLPDVYLTRKSRTAELGQVNPNNVRGFFQTDGSEEGAEFTTSGDVTFALALAGADEVFIGASGFNPDNISEFTLSPDAPDVQGIAERVEPGVYIGYDSSSQTWEILNFSLNNDELAIDVNSTTSISGLNAINFNPDSVAPTDRLLINTDQGLVDRTNEAGISDINIPGNSVTAGDFDNDMDVDLYIVATGLALNSENIFLDNQGDGTFVSVPNAGGAAGSSLGLGDSVTTADYDLDGFLDLFVTNGFVEGTPFFSEEGPQQLFRNQGNNNNWLEIDLEGVESNRDGIGAQVFLTAGGVTQLREQSGGVHKWSQNHQRIHFGLAENTQVDLLEIRWPSGAVQKLENIAANQLLTITEEDNINGTPPPINGTDGNDTLTGTNGDDLIDGLGARDVLFGLGGNDTLNGNEGNDNLQGGANDDVLNGNSGNDLLIGSIGKDTLTGGGDSDRFRFFRTNDGIDEITDFNPGEDTLEFDDSTMGGGLVPGTLPADQFVLGTTAADSSDRLIYNQSDGSLFFDIDGNGAEEQILMAVLSNEVNLSADDIVIF